MSWGAYFHREAIFRLECALAEIRIVKPANRLAWTVYSWKRIYWVIRIDCRVAILLDCFVDLVSFSLVNALAAVKRVDRLANKASYLCATAVVDTVADILVVVPLWFVVWALIYDYVVARFDFLFLTFVHRICNAHTGIVKARLFS